MTVISLAEAENTLSQLVLGIESGKHAEIILARDGIPVAKLVSLDMGTRKPRLGIAAGKIDIPDNFEESDQIIERLLSA